MAIEKSCVSVGPIATLPFPSSCPECSPESSPKSPLMAASCIFSNSSMADIGSPVDAMAAGRLNCRLDPTTGAGAESLLDGGRDLLSTQVRKLSSSDWRRRLCRRCASRRPEGVVDTLLCDNAPEADKELSMQRCRCCGLRRTVSGMNSSSVRLLTEPIWLAEI